MKTDSESPGLAASEGRSAASGLALMSFVAGSMDAIAFLVLGGIFSSAMSGNTVVLGIAMGQGRLTEALYAAAALLCYLLGVAVASLSLKKFHRSIRWTLMLEGLFITAFTIVWLAFGGPEDEAVIYVLIVLAGLAMGLQGGISRAIGAPGIMTVIFTSTYTAIVSNLVERIVARQRPYVNTIAARQLTALTAYLGGAILLAIVITQWRLAAPFLPLGVFMILLLGLRQGVVDFDRRAG